MFGLNTHRKYTRTHTHPYNLCVCVDTARWQHISQLFAQLMRLCLVEVDVQLRVCVCVSEFECLPNGVIPGRVVQLASILSCINMPNGKGVARAAGPKSIGVYSLPQTLYS